MKIGVPKEIKNHEYRVGMTPAAVREVVARGHEVWVETRAGAGIGMDDSVYAGAGAHIAANAVEVFEHAELIVKVKEPQAVERARLGPQHTLFTYLHLAPDPDQTRDLIKSGATCIAYETVTSANGGLPLLAPMSEVAGRMSIQAGATALEKTHGGLGLLLSGVPGVEAGKVVILGGGVVGTNAATVAVGMGAQVTVIDRSVDALRRISAQFGGRVQTVYSTQHAIETHLREADLVIGGVLIPGAAAPKLVTRKMLGLMRKGAVIVDVAIDQGGCCETSHATTHADPVYVVEGIVHYCVANMPGGVPRTSTFALNNVTLPFILQLADHGPVPAMLADSHLLAGLNVARGMVTNQGVADALGLVYHDPQAVLANLPAAA
ncbi:MULTISPECIES: alanine dehydrogenase [Pandoraea]|uniref:Alanine dehydrogenase n=1 Tax=Pandoraea communis TaxID=2508297 RepID=A0A5E4UXY4_9BURK|nr:MULTISPECIES: alanine dehydrogenase [Pandoraea]EON14374.1 alanine dehydrogenase [Pandoraea sp. SD6-2]VVE04781.1 alanine dehydrogenase [Pandoraea communis]